MPNDQGHRHNPSSRGRLADRGISGWMNAFHPPEIPRGGWGPRGRRACQNPAGAAPTAGRAPATPLTPRGGGGGGLGVVVGGIAVRILPGRAVGAENLWRQGGDSGGRFRGGRLAILAGIPGAGANRGEGTDVTPGGGVVTYVRRFNRAAARADSRTDL
jgi:hypothetical protein